MPGHHIIVGGGLAGLMTAMKLAEQGEKVDLFSIVPVKRSHSVCAQGGINGAVNTKGEGDSPMIHFDDTIYGGDFLANQPPVKGMCEAAPGIIYLFDRMGVMFNRTPEGLLDFRRFGGTKHHRTAFAGATTGQQLLYALDEQVRRYEVAGLIRKFEGWEMTSLVLDESGDCKGICAIDNRSLELRAFPGDTTMIATGGPGLIFGRSTQSLVNTGSAGRRRVSAGRDLRQRRVHPGASDRGAGRGQEPPHLGIDSRRRRPRVDLSRRQAVVLPRGDVSRRTATWCRATSRRARSSGSSTTWASASTASRWSISMSATSIPRSSMRRSRACSKSTRSSSARIRAKCR